VWHSARFIWAKMLVSENNVDQDLNRYKVRVLSVFWDITSCSPLKSQPKFGGTCRFKLQFFKSKPSKKPASIKQMVSLTETCNMFLRNTRSDF
jgi:hypothetical protein